MHGVEVDIHDIVYVHIDKKKKFPATALLRAFGYGENRDILRLFFAERELDLTKKRETRNDQREVLGASPLVTAAEARQPSELHGLEDRQPGQQRARSHQDHSGVSKLLSRIELSARQLDLAEMQVMQHDLPGFAKGLPSRH